MIQFVQAQLQLMGKREIKQNKPPAVESDEDDQYNQIEIPEVEEEEIFDQPFGEEEDEEQRNIQLLKMIGERANQAKDRQKLTWNAFYSLKRKEMDLNEKMNNQIELIKDKYELLRQPIYNQISSIALGQKLQTSLYRPAGIECNIDSDRVDPIRIQDFWSIVFEKQGILTEQVDVECIKNMKQFSCQIVDLITNHYKLTFKFNPQTSYFSNKQLTINIKNNPSGNGPTRQIKETLKYKTDKNQISIFTILFDSDSNQQNCFSLATQIYQNYSNALYFYFRSQSLELSQQEELNETPSKKIKQV